MAPTNPPHIPFAWLDGRPYLVVNFDLEPTGDLPPLRDLLDGLLAHYVEGEILLLRPLGAAEEHLLRKSTEDAEVEAWAQMIVKPEDRFRPRAEATRRRPRKR